MRINGCAIKGHLNRTTTLLTGKFFQTLGRTEFEVTPSTSGNQSLTSNPKAILAKERPHDEPSVRRFLLIKNNKEIQLKKVKV